MASASAGDYKDTLAEALCCFQCCKDHDVQDFLNTKAINFEKRGWATTYLLLTKEAFENGELKIEGYFSLTHKAVVFGDDASLSKRQKLTGKKKAETESFVLIGQLGKSIVDNGDGTITESSLTANDLLGDAFSIIQQSSDFIICRNVIIECKPIEKVKKLYEDYGFINLQYDEVEKLHTLYLRLDSNIIF